MAQLNWTSDECVRVTLNNWIWVCARVCHFFHVIWKKNFQSGAQAIRTRDIVQCPMLLRESGEWWKSEREGMDGKTTRMIAVTSKAFRRPYLFSTLEDKNTRIHTAWNIAIRIRSKWRSSLMMMMMITWLLWSKTVQALLRQMDGLVNLSSATRNKKPTQQCQLTSSGWLGTHELNSTSRLPARAARTGPINRMKRSYANQRATSRHECLWKLNAFIVFFLFFFSFLSVRRRK